jgi:hypothetical protein
MIFNKLRLSGIVAMLWAAVIGPTNSARAVLYLYEPFNYTAGQNLGGSGASMGSPIGQAGTYDAGVGGGAYNWYARGTQSNYQAANDIVISSGNLSYAGLATSAGNSVSYGSADNSAGANATNILRYADSVPLPVSVTSGTLYASFIVRINSRVYDGTSSAAYRHSMASFVTDTSDNGNAGAALAGQSGTGTVMPGGFWVRRDPVDATLNTTNFSPGKSSSDGINGAAVVGNNGGWQHSQGVAGGFIDPSQYGDVDGQPAVTDFNGGAINAPQTYFVVLKYSFDVMTPDSGINNNQADTVSLWMNPGSGTLGTATGEADATQAAAGNLGSYYAAIGAFGAATSDAAAINSFALIGHRQNIGQTISVDFDELRIGTTWQDVTPAASGGIAGDFNNDGNVDAGDYGTWRKNNGTNNALANDNGLGTPVGPGHYTLWRANFGKPPGAGAGLEGGTVPEPSAAVLLLIAIFGGNCYAARRKNCQKRCR